jgi:hypothetical protein
VEKKELLYTVGRNVNQYSHSEKEHENRFLKNLTLDLAQDPPISHLALYPKEMKFACQRHSCAPMLIAALFTRAKIQINLVPIKR